MKKEYAIVFPVAGLSGRFAGKPKWFVRVGPRGEPLIEVSLNQAIAAGFNKIFFIVGEHTEALFKGYFGDNYKGVPIYYPKQTFNPRSRDRPWGTVDALCSVLPYIDCPLVFCNGDDNYGESCFKILIEHFKNGTMETACIGHKLGNVIPDEGKVNRGIYTVDQFGYVRNLEENFDIEKSKLRERGFTEDSLTSMNLFAFYPETVWGLNQVLREFKKKNEGDRRVECLLSVEVGNMIKAEKMRMRCYPTSEKWFGITNPDDEEIVRREMKEYYG